MKILKQAEQWPVRMAALKWKGGVAGIWTAKGRNHNYRIRPKSHSTWSVTQHDPATGKAVRQQDISRDEYIARVGHDIAQQWEG